MKSVFIMKPIDIGNEMEENIVQLQWENLLYILIRVFRNQGLFLNTAKFDLLLSKIKLFCLL